LPFFVEGRHTFAAVIGVGQSVSIRSLARRSPMARGRFYVPPPTGMLPSSVSSKPKRAHLLAQAKSQHVGNGGIVTSVFQSSEVQLKLTQETSP
jgi:hypothetical protein